MPQPGMLLGRAHIAGRLALATAALNAVLTPHHGYTTQTPVHVDPHGVTQAHSSAVT